MNNMASTFQHTKGKIIVPHGDSTLTFSDHYTGPHTYKVVGEDADKRGLVRATAEELVHIIVPAYDSEDPTADFIRRTMEEHAFYAFNKVRYGREGAFIRDDRDGSPLPGEETLIAQLTDKDKEGIIWNKDRSLRFVPYEEGDKTKLFTKALLGEKGLALVTKLIANPAHFGSSYLLVETYNSQKDGEFKVSLSKFNRDTFRISACCSEAIPDSHWRGCYSYGKLPETEAA